MIPLPVAGDWKLSGFPNGIPVWESSIKFTSCQPPSFIHCTVSLTLTVSVEGE